MEPITDRAELVAALKDGAEIEHQLMCQYLYAALSLKKDPDPGCTPAQLERVRRWYSTLLVVARQEMEHLSLVNGMLTAIGAPPHFARENIGRGLQSPYFTAATLAALSGPGDPKPLPLPYAFERFQRSTIERFVCAESPPYADLPPDLRPEWCFSPPGVVAADVEGPTGRSHLAAGRGELAAGTVQELYTAIAEAFARLDDLFVPSPPEVTIPVEYDVFVFPVTDRASALAAVDLVLRQGEGLQGPWTYESHFRRFYDIRQELVSLQAVDPSFEPAHPLLENPEPSDIHDDFTLDVFELFNHAYATLCLMLASLYARFVAQGSDQDRYPHLSTALAEMAFAPTMTMVVRSLSEVLSHLDVGAGAGQVRTGPNYHLGPEARALLQNPAAAPLGDIGFFLGRWDHLATALESLAERAPGSAVAGAEQSVKGALGYIHQSAHRIAVNLRTLYQAGQYQKYVSI